MIKRVQCYLIAKLNKAGSIWAYIVPSAIALLYLQRISQKEQTMVEKYADYATYQQSSRRLIPFIW
ncbi:hypothetical protein [Chlorogloea sp. CCALA 695]|uniref:hypothetical protein n=1 Tax=Chlorogloea sp. CCALA 695 TaxID=2107693 RepID=UPI0018EAE90C|nr:hypothetical protein [Chlorogloea sp. CCALA 695]